MEHELESVIEISAVTIDKDEYAALIECRERLENIEHILTYTGYIDMKALCAILELGWPPDGRC